MKENKKKELEAKLVKLIFESEQPRKAEVIPARTAVGARVIRRRKGKPDLQIA